jgi:hypothetical protein
LFFGSVTGSFRAVPACIASTNFGLADHMPMTKALLGSLVLAWLLICAPGKRCGGV